MAFVEVKVSKKFSIFSVALLVLGGSLISINSAAAATAFKACSPLNAKTMIGSTSYTCQKNPATASTKLVWVSKPCATANKNYKSALTMTRANAATTTAALNAATRSITTNQRQLLSAQKNVDTWTKNMLSYTKTPTEAEKKQIAVVQAGIDRNKQRVIDAQAAITSLQAQIDVAKIEETKNADGLAAIKSSVMKACK